MLKGILSAALMALLAMSARDSATAKTIDTFDFSFLNGWVTGSDPTGTFTGTVEPDGLIEQTDLTSFSVTFFDVVTATTLTINLAGLKLFSFDPTGGASSLDFIASPPPISPINLCIGASASFDPTCGQGPPGVRGVLVNGSFLDDFTLDAGEVTLVSSVTVVPEASTWVMTLTGFAGLSLIRAVVARNIARRSSPQHFRARHAAEGGSAA
jgi:hypothetical protein